ncbi:MULTISPECIES: hypothetical protein [Aeromonas]|uniref:hypothetical protein n=1 Tax=Aeromonas TaxID=642 RepID=UPI00083AEEBD|nr:MULTISPECIES: hypothetical protein [Aeromonas]TNH85980.1 hypothetical protein CF140_04670 [Aeromonas sobria]
MTHKTLQLSALCYAVSLIASPAIAANTGFKTLTVDLPITTLQVVNDGLIRYDWRSDIDEDFRGKPKAGEGFLGRPTTGEYYYAVYQHKVLSFGGTMALYQDDSVASVKQAKADFEELVSQATKILKVKPVIVRTIKDKSVPFFECVTDSMCGDYSATYTIGTNEVSIKLMQDRDAEDGDRQLNAGMRKIFK